MNRRRLLRALPALSAVGIAGCTAPGTGSDATPCSRTESTPSETSVLEIAVANSDETAHELEVRFYDGYSGQYYCESTINVGASTGPNASVSQDFRLERGSYGIMIQLEDGRTAWTYWEVGIEPPFTVYAVIDDDALGIGGSYPER